MASGFSLADGLAYDYGEKKKYIRCVHSFEEDIIAAARNISKRYKGDPAHVKNLEAIGLKVFDKMKKIHGLGNRERLLLQISIILHNCGKYISLENVSECAYNIIMAYRNHRTFPYGAGDGGFYGKAEHQSL